MFVILWKESNAEGWLCEWYGTYEEATTALEAAKKYCPWNTYRLLIEVWTVMATKIAPGEDDAQPSKPSIE